MTLLQFLSILRARWHVALGVLVLAVAGTAIVNVILPKSYTSTAAVLVDVKSPDPIAGIIYPGLASPSYMATQVDVMQSDRAAQHVVRALHLNEAAALREQWRESTKGEGNFEVWLANLLRRSLEVKPSRESNVITVNYKSVDPKFATSLANAFAQAYIDVTLELRVEPARQYGHFFEDRAKQLREKVEQARARISGFQRDKGIVGADERLDVENARLNELSTQLTALQGMRSETASRQAQARNSPDRLQDTINNGVISNLRSELSRQEARLSELSSRLGDNHPSVIEARAGVAGMRGRIEQETQRVSGGVAVSNSINGARVAQIQGELDAQRLKVLRLKEARDQLAVLTSDLDSSQRAYDTVVARANQTELESRTTQTNVYILNPASEPTQPSSPRVTLNMLLALFIGTLLAVGVAMLMELFDRRVRSPGEVFHAVAIPLLGVLEASARGKLLGRSGPESRARRALPWRPVSAAHQAGAVDAAMLSAPPQRAARGEAAENVDATIPKSGDPDTTSVAPRALGDIFRETRKLDADQIEQILAYQREHALLFGEAAVALRLVEQTDVLWALSQQFRYSYADAAKKGFNAELIVATQPFSHVAESFRGIRSQLIRRLGQGSERRALAVVSADEGDGKSFVAANLAIVFSQLGRRTLLIDADMRTARLDRVFDISRRPGLSAILAGRVSPRSLAPIADLPHLFVLGVGTVPPNPLELLESPALGAMLAELATKFDYVIIDTPSASLGADAGVISACSGAYLAVARKGKTRMDAMSELVASLRDPSVDALGFIVNEH